MFILDYSTWLRNSPLIGEIVLKSDVRPKDSSHVFSFMLEKYQIQPLNDFNVQDDI